MRFDDKLPAGVSAGPGEGAMDLVATHQRLLVGAALRTTGPILELGVGWYSTPLLHEIAEAQGRYLLTVDNDRHWLEQFSASEWPADRGGAYGLRSALHRLELVGWWGDLLRLPAFEAGGRWGLCFVDQGQPIEREYAVRALIDRVDVFVMHDTEDEYPYGYCRTLPMFKHRWTDKCQKAWTTVASNRIDVTGWFRQLPPVEPTQEIT